MDPKHKKILRGISLEIRRLLEGRYDDRGVWQGGDLERRLNELGVRRDREAIPADELPQLSPEDKTARRLVDGYLQLRQDAGVKREDAVAEFVRESAYTWANRLFALRCMEAREIIDEVILQKDAYGGRSLVHNRFAKSHPEACAGEDDGLFAVLMTEFERRALELPAVFNPRSPAVALRPSIAALKQAIAWLSGRESVRGQEAATDEVFTAPDAFGWAYQYWNADEKDRVFERVRTKKGAKIEGADIIPATQLYTEPYMVKFLVQNSLGAMWMGMFPDSRLCEGWEYYVKDADRAPVTRKAVSEITFLDPAMGSGHFHLEAFDLFYAMYEEEAAREGRTLTPREICASILNHNLFGIDIDGRSVQIATAALWMKANEREHDLEAADLTTFHDHLVATNIRLPKGKDHLQRFLQKHPEDALLRPALELVFQGLEHADELGSLLQIEEPVDAILRKLKADADASRGTEVQTGLFEPTAVQGILPVGVEDYDKWKREALDRLQQHFESEAQAADGVQAFFGDSASRGLTFFNLLSRRYDIAVANPPYMHNRNMGPQMRLYLKAHFDGANLDLYAAFIALCKRLVGIDGFACLVSQHSFMFVASYKNLREDILSTSLIELVAHLGPRAFEEISGEKVNTALIVIRNRRAIDTLSTFLRLVDSENKSNDIIAQGSNRIYRIKQNTFSLIPGSPIIYWISDRIRLLFSRERKIDSLITIANRTKTGNNERFLRFWWETTNRNMWCPYTKGGASTNWVGGLRHCVRWDQGATAHFRESSDCRITDEIFWRRQSITYSATSGSGFAARLVPPIAVYDVKGPALIPIHDGDVFFILAYLNSRFASFVLSLLNPTLEVQTGDIERIPFPDFLDERGGELSQIGALCVKSKEHLIGYNPTELEFLRLPDDSQTIGLKRWCMNSISGRLTHQTKIAVLQSTIDSLVAPLIGDTAPDGESNDWLLGFSSPEFQRIEDSVSVEGIIGIEDTPLLHLVKESLNRSPARKLGEAEVAEILKSIRAYLEGESASEASQIPNETATIEEDVITDEIAEVGLPSESVIEKYAALHHIHPLSIYCLISKGLLGGDWRWAGEDRVLTENRFTATTLHLLGHRWPKQIESGEPMPEWADPDGVIPLTVGGGEPTLIDRVRERLVEDFPGGKVAALEREFEEIVGVPLGSWLAGPFFERHISQFKKRPIAWQIQTDARGDRLAGRKRKRGEAAEPVFACLIYYHKIGDDILPKLRTHYVGVLRGGCETELRTLEGLSTRTPEQEGRRLQLDQWVEEMKAFDAKLEQVTREGFGPTSVRPALRQYAIDDALLSLTAAWLRKLETAIAAGPLSSWQEAAADTALHDDLPEWIATAFTRVDAFCATVGPKSPAETTMTHDPTSDDLAPLVCADPSGTVSRVLDLANDRWWQTFQSTVIAPLKEQLKAETEELKQIKADLKLDEVKRDHERNMALSDRREALTDSTKALKKEIAEKTDRAKELRSHIERWQCAEATTWEPWLRSQPLFDAVASLDGVRPAPTTISEFIAQESAYAPDINDGVRVNIAPIQHAGLLRADVLDPKDLDKAIADRAEWRADERRWVREAKLPRPGWWKEPNS